MSVSGRLRAIREHLGESQKSMSLRMDLGSTTWQTYERGLNLPVGGVLARLAEMGLSVDWLLTGEGSMMRGEALAPAQSEATPGLTADLVATALQTIEEWLEQNDRYLPPAKKAEVVVLLCEMVLKEKAADRAAELSRQAGRILRLVA